MASKSQNPVPPKFPLGVDNDAAGFGAATCFPLGQVGLRTGIPYPAGSVEVTGAGTAAADGVYLYFEVGDAYAYANADGLGLLMFNNPLVPGWCILSESSILYGAVGSSGQAVPPTTGWTAVDGAAPVPTVSIIT